MTPSIFEQDPPSCGFCGNSSHGEVIPRQGIGLRCRNAFECAKRHLGQKVI